MDKVIGKLTVFFDEPFWVGIVEKIENGKVSVAKITFGAEPKNYDVQDFILKHYYDLQFSPPIVADVKEKKENPKRVQREIKKQLQNTGIGTKSQQALKLQREELKKAGRQRSKEEKLAEAQRLFELKQQKKKAKHRGH